MSKSIFAAVVALGVGAFMAAPATARVDAGPISSLYERDGRPLPRAQQKQRLRKSANSARRAGTRTAGKSAKYRGKSAYRGKGAVGRKARLAGRAVTSGRSGGGASASRTCLTPAARALLGRIEAHFGAVQVISTCRPGARIAGSGRISKHASGNAVDFNAGGRKAAIVSWLRANHMSGGTMTYARMSHIHVDIGPRFVSLGSGGGKGRRKG